MTSNGDGVNSGADRGKVEKTIADSDADQTVMSGVVGVVRRRVYSPGIDDETVVRRDRSMQVIRRSLPLEDVVESTTR